MTMKTVSVAEARANFSKIGEAINRTGDPVTVFKHSKPYLVIMPAAYEAPNAETRAAMTEAETILADPDRKHFSSFEDLMAALDAEDNHA